ncbi:MAG: N-acetylmuramoyl-L-alanine amidase family protein [Vallitalea sp.]|nr:N-acetylmuramoyl-L-alanine amidase family protein [Vallitalea sp.]
MTRKILSVLIAFTVLLNVFSINSNAQIDNNKFYLQYDGQIYKYKNRFVKLVMDGSVIPTGEMPSIIITENINGKNVSRTLVPVREVFESEHIGAKVDWNGKKQEVYISYEDKFIVLKINDKKAVVNNKEILLDVPSKLIQNVNNKKWKTMVPLRFIIETIGCEVEWNGKDYIAEMTKKKNTENNDNQDNETNNNETNDNEASNNDNNETNNNDNNNNEQSNNNGNETLNSLNSSKAKKELPTELKENPIEWVVEDDILDEVNNISIESTIKRKLCPTSEITSVEYKENELSKTFIIKASGPITDIKKSYWKNKLIIDIDNSKLGMDKYEKVFSDNPIITGVRSSQFSIQPLITRMVFDLRFEGYKFNISLSEDRKNIIINVTNNSIYGIKLGQDDKGDYIKVTGIIAPDVKPFRLSNPDRIVFDFPNTKSLISTKSSIAKGQYVKQIRTAQFDETTTRVVVETDGQADFIIDKQSSESTTYIRLNEPSYNNIKYVNYDIPTIMLEKNGTDIDISKIKYIDKYMDREYIINLSGNYMGLLGEGEIKVNDGIIDSIDIKNNDEGNTVLTIKENSVYDFRITEDKDCIYIKAYKPKELYSKIIVIDPGHGGKDPGADDGKGLTEKKVNIDITYALKKYLDKDNNIKTYYTRLDDTYITLNQRTELANEVEADFFISIHNNWHEGKAYGTEAFYYTRTDKNGRSYKLTDIFLKEITNTVVTKNRGIKQGNLYVLRNTNMPATLLEIAFLSNPSDVAKLKDKTFIDKVAHALYNAILKSFKVYPTGRK